MKTAHLCTTLNLSNPYHYSITTQAASTGIDLGNILTLVVGRATWLILFGCESKSMGGGLESAEKGEERWLESELGCDLMLSCLCRVIMVGLRWSKDWEPCLWLDGGNPLSNEARPWSGGEGWAVIGTACPSPLNKNLRESREKNWLNTHNVDLVYEGFIQ